MATKHRVITATDVEKDLRINTVRRPPAHKCSDCGAKYYRRNLMEQWTGRNEGHRYGWHKDIVKICTKCLSESESKRIIGIADVQFGRMTIVSRS